METLKKRYEAMQMQRLVADYETIAFYEKCGFVRVGKTKPMWIYAGNDH